MTDMQRTSRTQGAQTPRRPVNAAEAAHRAARARSRDEEERYRRQAMGTSASRASRREDSARAGRAISIAAVVVGALLAAVAFFVLGRALLDVLLYSDETPVSTSKPAETGALAVTVDPDDASANTLEVSGRSFGVSVDDEGTARFYRMAAAGDAADATELIAVSGEPAGMAYAGGTFFAVVNVDEGYEVWACSDSQGALATCVSSGSDHVVAVGLEQDVLTLEGEQGVLASLSLDGDDA